LFCFIDGFNTIYIFYLFPAQRQSSAIFFQSVVAMTTFQIGAFLWLLPLIYLFAGSLVSLGRKAQRADIASAWAVAEAAALAGLAITLVAVATAAWQAGFLHSPGDALGLALAALISVLGWVIIRYSRRYLHGEPGQRRYIAAMLLTLASVAVVVLTTHLGLLVLAWIASSLSVHRLLTFYRDRTPALIVAHKKFIASRMADACLLAALVLIHRETGTLDIPGITHHVSGLHVLPAFVQVAMGLTALAVILKSAQLPVHGWLIQVMEAPTPVSALLHAGIVNLGGFVLIRLAALLSGAPAAQTMLVVVGSVSAVLAGLVMLTRISIKVRLAWSTCAQMGFMLLECGLGLYALALLHLVAHSLYKAHAFLTAGEAVLDTRRRQLFPAARRGSPAATVATRLAAAPLAVGLVAASAAVWQLAVPGLTLPAVAVLLVGLGLAPLLWREGTLIAGSFRGVIAIALLAQLYMVWHLAFGALVKVPSTAASPALLIWTGACFAVLYLAQVWLLAFPRGALSTSLYPWAYAGFYLDERFTRLTFRLWPVRLPAPISRSITPHHIPAGDKA
jgi:NAD(P)H-quinone oxidoreductase subunit 5